MNGKKAKVKTGLARKPVDQKLADGDRVVESITGNPDYDPAEVDLTDITAARDAMRSARTRRDAAKQQGESLTEELEKAEQAYDDAFRALARDAEKHTGNDAEKLKGGGFETFIPGARTPQGVLPAPENVLAKPGEAEGTLKVSWLPVEGARNYTVRITTDVTNRQSWRTAATPPISAVVLDGLKSGTHYWVLVIANGTKGPGTPSDKSDSVAR